MGFYCSTPDIYFVVINGAQSPGACKTWLFSSPYYELDVGIGLNFLIQSNPGLQKNPILYHMDSIPPRHVTKI